MAIPDPRLKILIVDDDDLVISSLRLLIGKNYHIQVCQNIKAVPKDRFHVAFVDMHLTGNLANAEGLTVIAELAKQDPQLEIVAMSGNLDRALMEHCLAKGASRFLAKPLLPDEVLQTLEKIETLILIRQISLGAGVPSTAPAWIGTSSHSERIRRDIASLAGESGPILIEGESGTGKEIAAHLLHLGKPNTPFISVNVAALPDAVFESEFFGHVRGAFTGAETNKIGLAEAAHHGDLFLDEIEAIPLNQQAKLLRFLESGEIRKVGGTQTIRVNVRVIAASNRSLEDMVRAGQFREDLFWRIAGKRMTLPPLRDRIEDVAVLAEYFLQNERPRRNKTLSVDAAQALSQYSFPGNVRELKRLCEQMSLHSALPLIRPEDVERVLPLRPNSSSAHNSLTGAALDLTKGLNQLIEDHEAQVIRAALRARSNIDDVVELLKISRSSLYKKMKDYNISTEETS